jgi:uncharacterized damage-inducible protein DinB
VSEVAITKNAKKSARFIPLKIALCFGIALISSIAPAARAQDKAPAATQAAAPTAGARAEFLGILGYYEQRYARLAEADPADKYAWRPGEGVRSIGEVYAHIAMANYGVARALGADPPAGFDFKAVQAAANDKAKIDPILKESFAQLQRAVLAINDADMDKPQKMFGYQTTVRGSFMMITAHFGEHLGQSIAYARSNGIVPPWTEESQQKQKAAEKPKP